MIYFVALLAGLVAGLSGGFAVGFGAAELFTKLGGPREGAAAMGGFFFIGPFGLVAAFLATFGVVVRYGNGHAGLAKGTMIAGACVAGLGILLVLWLTASANGIGSGPSADFVLEMEVRAPAGANLDEWRWEYVGTNEEGTPSWQLHHNRKQADGSNVALLPMSMTDLPPHRYIRVAQPGKPVERFDVPVPARVEEVTPWSAWETRPSGAAFRWRMRKS